MAPCSLVEICQCFIRAYFLLRKDDNATFTLMMEAVTTSETSVYFYEKHPRRRPSSYLRRADVSEELTADIITTLMTKALV
jgi:hypothetical protein